MKKLAIILVIICAISAVAPYAQAGTLDKVKAYIKKKVERTKVKTPTAVCAVRG
jgi:uncharacterized protein YxeA